MKLLCDERLPVEAVEWRFLWRWLRAWGLAPDLNGLDELGKNFTRAPCEIDLLQKAAFANTDRLKDLAGDPGSRRALMAAKKLFAGAARQAEGFLREM
jgi:hypothetical protein